MLGGLWQVTLIVIEALNESGDADTRVHFLQILAETVNDDESCIANLPGGFRSLVTLRPLPEFCGALNDVKHVARKSLGSRSC